MAEIAEADAIGDPSLLRDGVTDRERTALETYRDARTAMALIREAVDDCALRAERPDDTVRTCFHFLGTGTATVQLDLFLASHSMEQGARYSLGGVMSRYS